MSTCLFLINCMIFLSPFLGVKDVYVNCFFPCTARCWNSVNPVFFIKKDNSSSEHNSSNSETEINVLYDENGEKNSIHREKITYVS